MGKAPKFRRRITIEIRKILEDLGDDEDPEAVQRISRVVAAYHRGPLPLPSMLRGYERVLPGCADRIVAFMKQKSTHRRELEATTVRADIRSRYVGQISALILCLAVVGVGFAAVLTGQAVAGIVAIFIAVCGVATTFLHTGRRQQRELQEKRAAFPEE